MSQQSLFPNSSSQAGHLYMGDIFPTRRDYNLFTRPCSNMAVFRQAAQFYFFSLIGLLMKLVKRPISGKKISESSPRSFSISLHHSLFPLLKLSLMWPYKGLMKAMQCIITLIYWKWYQWLRQGREENLDHASNYYRDIPSPPSLYSGIISIEIFSCPLSASFS